jgi:glycosyltransferase involved in cell wall biosynthesis
MRIAFVCQHLAEPEGAAPARALYALCSGLIAEGHEVSVLSWRAEEPRDPLPPWVAWRALPSEPRGVTRARALVRPRSDVLRLGWRPPEDAVAVADDVSSFAAVADAPRSVMTFHYLTRFDRRIRPPVPSDLQTVRAERRAARRASLVTAMSERVARAASPRAVVVPMAYPIPDEPLPFVEEPVAGLLANWMWPPNLRALDDLLAAWPTVRELVPGARLVLGGQGSERIAGSASDGVEIIGPVARAADVLGRCAVVAFPCPDTSGPKVKILEALANGVPVVTTTAGIEGLRLPDGAGAVVAPLAGYAGALAGLLVDPERRRELSRTGREAVREYHGPLPAARARIRAYERAFGTLP